MPKLKTHKGARDRIRITGSGKLLRMKGHRSHLRRKKPHKVRRQFAHQYPLHPSDRKRISRLLPYGV